jgi:hypothetical protein
MFNAKSLFALTVLAPIPGATVPAEAAKSNATAARAECFRQANEAVAAAGFSANTAQKNSDGLMAYRQCCYKDRYPDDIIWSRIE